MSNGDVVIVRTGAGNLASVEAAFRRLGLSVDLVEEPEMALTAPRLVLPGVGSFGVVMEHLRSSGLAAALSARIEEQRPTLAICLGLQLLGEGSEESPGRKGLGVLPIGASRFPEQAKGVRVPHLGWNSVEANAGCRILESGAAYFANSFRLKEIPQGWQGAWSEHGGPFVAALERGSILGCQFHPELSGDWGEGILRRWLSRSEVSPC